MIGTRISLHILFHLRNGNSKNIFNSVRDVEQSYKSRFDVKKLPTI